MAYTFADCVYCFSSDEPWTVSKHEPDCCWLDPDYSDDAQETFAYEEDELEDMSKTTKQTFGFKATKARSCFHAMDAFTLPDGTVVYLTAFYDRHMRGKDNAPDFGCYLASSWWPTIPALMIGWPDYGTPSLSDAHMLTVAAQVLAQARSGAKVEIGCLGAHGRTGTFLGLLVLLTMGDPQATEAIRYVRSHHCWKAIESIEQEWWLTDLAAAMRGEPRKARHPKRVLKPSKSKKSKHARSKLARIENRKLS